MSSPVRWLVAALLTLALAVGLEPVAVAGTSKVTADNSSKNTDTQSGNASSTNNSGGFVGQNSSSGDTTVAAQGSASAGTAGNVQNGDNNLTVTQESHVKTGTAVGGQVIGGVVNGGNLKVDATNHSERVDVKTGDATGNNDSAAFVGLAVSSSTDVSAAGATALLAQNVQDGDNEANISQAVDATSGDGIAGQIIGAAVNGGTTDITAANTSDRVDVGTGDANGVNTLAAFVGLDVSTGSLGVRSADATAGTAKNIQSGDNSLNADQTARSITGNGIAGEVIGVNSSGNTTVNASNVTTRSDVDTGNSDAVNSGAAFVGLAVASDTTVAPAGNATAGTANNVQSGDNASDIGQTADATSGDAIVGQIVGVNTSAGATADVVLSNVSNRNDATSGTVDQTNLDSIFTGLDVTTSTITASNASADPLRTIFEFAIS